MLNRIAAADKVRGLSMYLEAVNNGHDLNGWWRATHHANSLAMIDQLQGVARSPQSRAMPAPIENRRWALTTSVVQSWQTLRNGHLITRARKVLEKG